ncbi:MAG: hypothetical protein AAGB23_04485 [Pseudomonadota bacterium]
MTQSENSDARSDRRGDDRRQSQRDFKGPDRRAAENRRSGRDRRATVRVPGDQDPD